MSIIEKKPEVAPEKSKVEKIPVPKHSDRASNEYFDEKTNTYLFIVNGRERWLTKSAAEVTLQRSASTYNGFIIEIPKGSPYTPPPDYQNLDNCKGCGKR